MIITAEAAEASRLAQHAAHELLVHLNSDEPDFDDGEWLLDELNVACRVIDHGHADITFDDLMWNEGQALLRELANSELSISRTIQKRGIAG